MGWRLKALWPAQYFKSNSKWGMEALFLKRILSVLFVSALSLVSASAATIFTDGLPTVTDIYNTTTAGNFTALSGNVDVLQSTGPYGGLCAGVPTCIDLDGNTAGSITSGSLSFAPGTYVLTFTLNNAQRGVVGSTQVSLASLFNATYTDPAPGTVSATFTVASATTASLVFTSLVGGAAGDTISRISIVTASAVPEPSTVLLMSLPLLVFGARLRRKA